jgi:uncharacterized protein YjbI with pentapeptide repeats
MSPEVEAAIIAAGVGILTLIGAVYGTRKTSRDTKDALKQQITEQGEQLDKTLKAQSDQLDRTLAEQRTRTLNERFATAAAQIGDNQATVRLAGVHAMAGLADDWPENRQTCVDVLCAYLRMPYARAPAGDASSEDRKWLAWRGFQEVRHTIIRVITAHLKEDAAVGWHGLNFDFTGVVFDGGNFRDAQFSGGTINFTGAQFSGGTVRFYRAEFSGGDVSFDDVLFSGGTVDFGGAQFSGGAVYFSGAEFSGGTINLHSAEFLGGDVYFSKARFSGSTVNFRNARFSGGTVDFSRAEFSGGTVDFSDAGDWSFPPVFPWTDTPPSGVKLPRKEAQPEA